MERRSISEIARELKSSEGAVKPSGANGEGGWLSARVPATCKWIERMPASATFRTPGFREHLERDL